MSQADLIKVHLNPSAPFSLQQNPHILVGISTEVYIFKFNDAATTWFEVTIPRADVKGDIFRHTISSPSLIVVAFMIRKLYGGKGGFPKDKKRKARSR